MAREWSTSSPVGLHRVVEPVGVLPQAAYRLDARPEIWPDEVRAAGHTGALSAGRSKVLERSEVLEDAECPADPGHGVGVGDPDTFG